MSGYVINNSNSALHSEEPEINLKVEVYSISYDWGIASMGSPNFQEFAEPYYKGTLDGQITSANFSVDSTSDIRYSCSFSIILDYGSEFIVHANDNLFWENVWLKAIKIYEYPNGNKETDKIKDEHIIGWFVPNSGSYSYNAETRELSLSCTDMMSFLTDTRGGHLTDHWESLSGLQYIFYDTYKNGTSFDPQGDSTDKFLKENAQNAARYAGGIFLEGDKNLSLKDKQYDNFLTDSNSEKLILWNEKKEKYQSDNKEDNKDDDKGNDKDKTKNKPWQTNFLLDENDSTWKEFYYDKDEGRWKDKFFTDANSMVVSLVSRYAHIIPIHSVSVNLQNGFELLPYDMEFNGDTTLYDVLKKVADLYPRQSIYFDADRRLNVVQYALSWDGSTIAAKKHDFSGLTLEEHWSVNLENIKNFTVVWGRNQTCIGYYGVTSTKGICPNCGRFHEFYHSPTGADGSSYSCMSCGTPLQRLNMSDETFSTQRIGTHKQVIYNDNLITDKECFDAAKALTIASCRAKKTLSVTFFDRYLPLYDPSNGEMWGSDTGVGRLVEYTSALTGETDLYTLIKWSNDFNSGTVTIELEPFYPCVETTNVLQIPEFTFEINNAGLMTLHISGEGELFKIYCSKSPALSATDKNIWYWTTLDLDFIGETETSVFTYQFTESGTYSISCQAWSSIIFPSALADYKVVNVTINEDVRIDISTGETSTIQNGNNIAIGINYLTTSDDEYITDSDGNKFVY